MRSVSSKAGDSAARAEAATTDDRGGGDDDKEDGGSVESSSAPPVSEEDLPAHTASVRSALRHCAEVLARIESLKAKDEEGRQRGGDRTDRRGGLLLRAIEESARAAAREIESGRDEALRRFLRDEYDSSSSGGRKDRMPSFRDGDSPSSLSPSRPFSSSACPIDVVRISSRVVVVGDGGCRGGGEVGSSVDGIRAGDETVGRKSRQDRQVDTAVAGVGEGKGEGEGEDDDVVLTLTPLQFKRRYVHRNIPCVVRGLEKSSFAGAHGQWRRKRPRPEGTAASGVDDAGDSTDEGAVDEDWFRRHLGDDTMVPVRVSPRALTRGNGQNGRHREDNTDNNARGGLDDDGRAAECETLEMPLSEWIRRLRCPDPDPSMYLKDWHLVKFLEGVSGQSDTESAAEEKGAERAAAAATEELYSVPSVFGPDLLNDFLLRYTDGDYRFVYWGPESSRTDLHSDVLHSFSWSHNVCGEKEWTFYPPSPPPPPRSPPSPKRAEGRPIPTEDNGVAAAADADAYGTLPPPSFVVTQKAGETVFVPSGWKHEVVNAAETLSINHNWTTAASVDRVLDCLLTETEAVERELEEWGIGVGGSDDDDDMGPRESMLRGCAGLDLSSFFFAALAALADLREHAAALTVVGGEECGVGGRFGGGVGDSDSTVDYDEIWECFFGLARLEDIVRLLIGQESDRSRDIGSSFPSMGAVRLERRLEAVLMSTDLARQAIGLAEMLSGVRM